MSYYRYIGSRRWRRNFARRAELQAAGFCCRAAAACCEPASWPINLDDVTPLEWWRTMPANHLGETPQLVLRGTLSKISLMQGRQWLAAIRGDAAASIAAAIEAMPIDQISLEVDLMMTALMVCALDGNAGAALVLAHILHRVPLEHPFAQELSLSWLALNLRRGRQNRNRSVAARSESNAPDHPSPTRLGAHVEAWEAEKDREILDCFLLTLAEDRTKTARPPERLWRRP
jgi:hypothetical protein